MLSQSKRIMLTILFTLATVFLGFQGMLLAEPEAMSVTISPAEDYNPIKTQHTLVAQVKGADGSPVSGASVEWILNRAPGCVGDIVSMSENKPQKISNSYGIVKTDEKGEARLTITSTREGYTDITAYVPSIKDPAAHKQFAVKYWVNLNAYFPSDAENAIGTNHVFVVRTIKASDGMPMGNVNVRWTIIEEGPRASFKDVNSPYIMKSDPYGFAAITLRQTEPLAGKNRVKIEILSPANPEFVLLSKEVTKTWIATKLGVTKVGPSQIPILSNATYDINVQNTGDLDASGVVLTDTIPDGMSYVSSTPNGVVSGKIIRWNIGQLNKEQGQAIQIVLKGTQAGLWTNTVVASSREFGTATAQAITRVLPAPEVMIKKTGPSGVFVGFTRTYTLTVTNTGAVTLNKVIVTDNFPEYLSFKSSIPEGSVAGNEITWDLDTLSIGESKRIIVILGGAKSGVAVNTASVTTQEGVVSSDSLNITVLSAPGAHMSLIDSSDPVAVDDIFIYTIKVLNQSSGNNLHNMTIVGLLPEEVEYVDAKGDTSFTVVGREIRFNPVEVLKADETVKFYIKVKAVKAGPAVFNSTMRWDEFGEPIVNQEGTTVFLPRK